MNILEILREEFEKELQSKTGWGRIEVMTAFDKACARAMYKWAKSKGIDISI